MLKKPPALRVNPRSPSPSNQSVITHAWSVTSDFTSCTANLGLIGRLINPDPRTPGGRLIGICQVGIFVVLALAALFVQMYTNIQAGLQQTINQGQMEKAFDLAVSMFNVSEVLSAEMIPFYLYSNATYAKLMDNGGQTAVINTDVAVIFLPSWPTDFSLLVVSARVNLTSLPVLQAALRKFRSQRSMGVQNEVDVFAFYTSIINSMSTLVRGLEVNMPRFPGWHDFFAYQRIFNAKSYADQAIVCATKRIMERRTKREASFKNCYLSLVSAPEYLSQAAAFGGFEAEKVANITKQSNTNRFYQLINDAMLSKYTGYTLDEWLTVSAQYQADLQYIKNALLPRVHGALKYSIGSWLPQDLTSLGLFIGAAVASILMVFLHFLGTSRMQKQIVSSNKNVEILDKTLSLLFDYLPKAFVGLARNGEFASPRYVKDACVVLLDLSNATTLMLEGDAEEFSEILTTFYQTMEEALSKYNCFKIEIAGELFALGSGVGEPHGVDHIAEMMLMTLDVVDAIAERNKLSANKFALRIGLHVGSAVVKMSMHPFPKMLVLGEVMATASLIHATALPMKVQVSNAAVSHLINLNEVEFIQRGIIGKADSKIMAYWAQWTTDLGSLYSGATHTF